MFGWVFDVPLWVSGPGLIVLLVGVALGGLHAVRSLVVPRLRIKAGESEFTGPLMHTVMVFYALVLGLIAVNVFETHSETARIVSREAATIASVYRNAGSYPEPTRSLLQTALRDYTEYVIHDAWPLQRSGHIPSAGVDKADGIQAYLAAFEPVTEAQKILHAETWRAYDQLIEARRERLHQVTTGLPGVMWLVVLLGAAISLTATFFFRVEDVRFHAILVGLLAVFIATVIFLVLALDRPFRGDLGVSSESYQLVLDQLMKR